MLQFWKKLLKHKNVVLKFCKIVKRGKSEKSEIKAAGIQHMRGIIVAWQCDRPKVWEARVATALKTAISMTSIKLLWGESWGPAARRGTEQMLRFFSLQPGQLAWGSVECQHLIKQHRPACGTGHRANMKRAINEYACPRQHGSNEVILKLKK